MARKLDDKLSNVFIKQDTGLYTELFIIGELGLKGDAGKNLSFGYTPKERFKLMKKEYNLAPDNIVKPLAFERSDGKSYLIFERIDGDMLVSSLYRLKKDRLLCKNVKEQILNVVEKLHSNGYVHGDLVGGNNIMLTKDGTIKLIDQLYVPKKFRYGESFVKLDDLSVKSVINLINLKVY